MKQLLIILLSLAALCSRGEDLYLATLRGADFDVRLHIVDDEGRVVSGAKCTGWIFLERAQGHGHGYAEVSDTDGNVHLVGRSSEWVRVIVRKEGYYQTKFEIKYPERELEKPLDNGKWQPYGAMRTVVLKRIKTPGKTIGFDDRSTRHAIPAWEKWLGFDFELGDWVPPYGKGAHEDVLLRFKEEIRKRPFDFTSSMEVSFTNNPHAGAYIMKKDETSLLKSDYDARTNAVYLSSLDFLQDSWPNKSMISKVLEHDSYLVFRTRTRVDEKGRLVGAHYGKIYYWMWGEKEMALSGGCFNPIENDSSIEGDTTLRRQLKLSQQSR